MAKAPLTNRYSNFDFPDYVYHEYPKAVLHNGKNYVVNDAEEEKALKAKVRDFRKEALDRAKELKLEIPDDWKLEKIQAFIKKAEADLEFERLNKEEAKAVETPVSNKLTLAKKPGSNVI